MALLDARLKMNKILNDRGEWVVAVGAPASIERVKVERPTLISALDILYWQSQDYYGRCVDDAIKLIREHGIRSELETRSVLMASAYSMERAGSVTDLVMSI